MPSTKHVGRAMLDHTSAQQPPDPYREMPARAWSAFGADLGKILVHAGLHSGAACDRQDFDFSRISA